MANDRPPNLTLGLVLLLAVSFSSARECKISCSNGPNLIKLESGKSYVYDLVGSTVTTKPGAKSDVAKLGLSAKVEIVAGANCENVITLSNVQTSGPDGKKYSLDKTLGSAPSKFGLSGGKLEELCVDPSEPQSSVNIKRAAISLLQAAISKESGSAEVTETDIFGICPTSLDSSKSGNTLTVRKLRNLNRCGLREGVDLLIPSTSYYNPSDIQGSDMLSGELKVTQQFEGGALKSAEAQEVYEYNPTAALEAGTKVTITTKLTLSGTAAKGLPDASKAIVPKSIRFDVPHEEPVKGTSAEIAALLKKGIESRTVDSTDATIFSSLVKAVNAAPKDELLTVYNQAKSGAGFSDKETARKMLLDAIFSASSASRTETLAELIKSKEVPANELPMWYARIGAVKHVSRAALTATLPLLDGNAPDSAYLHLGILGRIFCSEHPCGQYGVAEVTAFQKKLAAPLLTKGCSPASHKEEDQLIVSLKGVANMKFLTKDVADKLAECFVNPAIKSRVRSAVADVIRSDPHQSQVKEAALKVFQNAEEDSELRIKAYLALLGCPCGKVAEAVKNVLNGDSLQVGSFVISSLRNIRASVNPDKADAKKHLGGILSAKRWPIDPRKFSQNQELSYSLDLLNVGAALENNIIYSQQSWLPRSLSVNVTSQLYGHAFNLIELDARLENVERAVESLLGPKGYVNTHKPEDIASKAKSYASSILEKIASRYDKAIRPKRSAASWAELKSLADKVKLGPDTDKDINIDLSLKSGGSELGWLKLHSLDGKPSPNKIIDDLFGKLDDAVNGAKDFNKDYRRHIVLIDQDFTYPTSLGLPLKLKGLGTVATRVKLDGKIDLPAIIKNPKSADLKLQLIPSAAIHLRGDLSIDGIAIETGTRTSLNLHSSTGTDITVRLLDGQGIDVMVGLPISKQEIVSLKTDVSATIKEPGKAETATPVSYDVKRETYSGCFDQVDTIIGLTFCGKVSTPWEGSRSISPAYGPSELTVEIVKEDPSLSKYHIKLFQQAKDGKANFEFLFDTPNSQVDRKVSVVLDAEIRPKKYVKLSVQSPWTQATLDGNLVENDNEISALAKLDHDGAEYLFKAGAKKTKTGKQLKLEPIFEYKAPEMKSSLIGRRTGPKAGNQQAYSASGVILVDLEDDKSRKWKIQGLSINTPRGSLVLDGTGSYSEKGIEGDNKLTFGEDSVTIKAHALQEGNTKSLKLAVSPSQYKDASFDLLLSQTKTGELGTKLDYENKIVLTHGPDPNSKESRLSIINKLKRDAKASSLSLSSQVKYPIFQVDIGGNFAIKPNSLSAGGKAKVDRYSGGLQVKGDIDNPKAGDYNVAIEAEAMGKTLSVLSSRKIGKPNQSKFANSLEVKPGGKYEVNALVTHNFGGGEVDFQVDADAKMPVEPKSINIKTGLRRTKSENKAYLKATAGSKLYIDADGNIKKSEKPAGGYKLKLPGYLDSNGDFSYDGANLKAKALLDLPKADKKAEAKADLVVKDNKVAGNIDLSWDAKDPAKSLKIQTDSARLAGDTQGITSKNTITYKNAKTILNGKYLVNGKEIASGKLPEKGSTSGELEIVLPSGFKLTGKGADSWDLATKQAESLYGLTVQEAGKGPRDINLKIVGKNFDTDPIQFDTSVTLSYVNPDKKDAILHAILKKVPKDGKWIVKGEIGSSGSLIPKPITAKLDTDISEKILEGELNDDKTIPPITYKLSLTAGSDVAIESTGKVGGTTIAGDLSAKLPGPTIKSLKYSTSNTIDIIPAKGKQNKIKTSQQLSWNEDKFIKAEVESICEDGGLRYSAEWETNSMSKRKLTGSAHYTAKDGLKLDGSANLAWEGKTADVNAKVDSNKDGSVIGATVIANTPGHGKSNLIFKNKIIKEGKGFHTDIQMSSGDKKLAALSKIELDKEHPLVDINIDHPDGQSKLLFKNDRKGPRHYLTELKAKWSNNGGALSIENEANMDSMENLSFKSNLELPDHKKMNIDVSVKDGKKVSFIATKDSKPWLSGNANYEKKVEGKTKSVSGKGEVEIEGKSYPLAYEAVYEELQDGDKFKMEIEAGKRKMSGKLIRLPNDFTWERTYCKEDGKCSKAFITSKISSLSAEEHEQTTAVQLDLSLMNPEYQDIGYKSTYKRKGLIQDQNIELQWSNTEKLKYNAYVHEKQSGIILALPKRTVGAELLYDVAKKGDKAGNIKIEADLWLNKEKNDKLCLIATTEVTRDKENTIITGETKITHPSLKKDLIVKGKASVNDKLNKIDADVVVDIFKKPNQKIVATFKSGRNTEGKSYTVHRSATVKSEGCKLNAGYSSRMVVNTEQYVLTWSESAFIVDSTGAKREASANYEANTKKISAKAKIPDLGIQGELELNLDKSKKEASYSASSTIAGIKYNANSKYTLEDNHLLSTAVLDGRTIVLEAGAKFGKSGILKLVVDSKSAAELNVALDEPNFLKSKYNYDIDSIKAVWHAIASSTANTFRALDKQFVDLMNKQRKEVTAILECLSDTVPDLSAAGEHIKAQLKQIKEELISDKTISKLGKNLKESLGKVADQIEGIVEELVKFVNTINGLVQELVKKLGTVAKEVGPKIQDSIEKISNMIVELAEQVVQLSIKISDAVLEELKKHEADIKAYLQTITDFIHDVGKQFSQLAFALQDELKKFAEGSIESLKDLPLVTMIKEKLEEIKQMDIPEEAWSVYFELVDSLKAILPTKECEDFVTAASDVLVKLLKREPINTEQAGKDLYTKGEAAIRSITKKLAEYVPKQATWKPSKIWSLSWNKLIRVPTGGLRLSIINWILAKDIPTIYEVLAAYTPSLNPLDNIPPFKGVGAIIGGGQIVTFDGQYIDTSGTCSYVLAQDYVDGNFSVSAEYSGTWYLKSITLSNAKDSITLLHKGQPLLNGKPAEFPVQSGDLVSWITPYGVVMMSKAGAKVVCDHLLAACQVEVSGFYFNKLRGLLGNLNYEKFDDLLTPEDKVAKSATELTNAWKTNAACASAPALPPPPRQALCTDLFSKDPELLIGKPWANNEPWRSVCDHSVANAPDNMKKQVACEVAKSYVYFARAKGAVFLRLPSSCADCQLDGKPLGDWSTKEVTTGKAADIVLIVESTTDNEATYKNYVNPLLAALKPELGKQGISDVKVSVVSYNPSLWWPAMHTSKGALSFEPGSPIDIKWIPRPEEKDPVTTVEKVKDALKKASLETGTTPLARAYEEVAANFDFRPQAVKAVIGVHGKPCHSPLNMLVPAKVFLGMIYTELKGATYSLITPVKGIEIDGIDDKNIVGFDSEGATGLDGKEVEGDALYEMDYCVDSAGLTGSVFPTNNFEAAKAAGKGAEFINLSAQRLAKTIAKGAGKELDCRCATVDGLHPRYQDKLE
ncbi:Domain of Unknown Function (DUF1081) [Nesidiocoris tenuis]|uniref:Vitellogenin domain-containing protein n=1 Tax=Nesidiocoris tenuis TaxID=355587 RepID=A0ABN7B661_9HEMI|nr:Domain of Unknown Function (DUF1081) [Nesidiocoris tenuis]